MNHNNFIFNIKHYKKIFEPLKNINLSDYKFIMDVITKGADIKRSEIPPSTSHPNYPIKDKELIEKVTKKLLHHLELGQLRGPYDLLRHQLSFEYKIHTSPISAKLKPSGKAIMLVDESAPKGDSINSAIDPDDKCVTYTDFKQLCALLKRIGKNGWIWVIDAVDAYYRIPIHKRFHHLFGIVWLNKLLIYKCLSFGLSTAPSIYNRFADLIQWACTYWKQNIFVNQDMLYMLHYLDDFFGGHSNRKIASKQMQFVTWLFEYLNIPTNPSKVVGPTQQADILGWCCRTNPKVQIGLSNRKRKKYLAFILHLLKIKNVNFIQFEKSVGYVRHTCKIYLEGINFVRGLEKQKFALKKQIEDSNTKTTKFTKIPLSPESIFDLEIWAQLYQSKHFQFLDIDFVLKPESLPTINIWTDASTSFGAGGLTSTHDLYHLPWSSLNIRSRTFSDRQKYEIKDHIIYLELFAMVLMAKQYAHKWTGKFIQFWCDNTTAVKAVKKGSIKFTADLYYPKANLVKLLAQLALKYKFHYDCNHIKGKKNVYADALSRNDKHHKKLRNKIYKMYNKKSNIPSKIASNIINFTCVNKFCGAFNI